MDDIVRVMVESKDWDRTKESINFILGLIEDYIELKEAVEHGKD